MKTTVVHVRDGYDIYIGRANGRARLKQSIWANPYRIGCDGTREEVIAKYRAWLMAQPELLAQVGTLQGKRLGCWCKKQGQDVPCHGDVLAELAEEQFNQAIQQAALQFFTRLADGGVCTVCGEPIERKEKIGRCVVGWPCGHRMYQGGLVE